MFQNLDAIGKLVKVKNHKENPQWKSSVKSFPRGKPPVKIQENRSSENHEGKPPVRIFCIWKASGENPQEKT